MVDRKRFPIENEDCYLTGLHVCQSNAGYYIGRMCWDKEGDFEEPFSRESGYYRKKEDAEKELHEGFEVRECLENEWAYEEGHLPEPPYVAKPAAIQRGLTMLAFRHRLSTICVECGGYESQYIYWPHARNCVLGNAAKTDEVKRRLGEACNG